MTERKRRITIASAEALIRQTNAVGIYTDPRLKEARQTIIDIALTHQILERSVKSRSETKRRIREKNTRDSSNLIAAFCGRTNMRCDRFSEGHCPINRDAAIRDMILHNRECNIAVIDHYYGIMSKEGFRRWSF